jgi:hypothetical protein
MGPVRDSRVQLVALAGTSKVMTGTRSFPRIDWHSRLAFAVLIVSAVMFVWLVATLALAAFS